ncbi:hypothetical protein LEMLEM_LOCUS1657 [Lemmus lemmus]
MNLRQCSWSFSGTSRRHRLRWHNGVLQSQTSPADGKACYFAEARSLLQLLGGDNCYLAKDSIVSLRPLGRAPPAPPPLAPSHASPGALRGAAVGPRGVASAPGAPAPRGPGRGIAASPGARLVARSLPDPLK